jgi:hypothetical protein
MRLSVARIAPRRVPMLILGAPRLEDLGDDFERGAADVEARGFFWHREDLIATQAIAGGELELDVTGGGVGQAFWFNENEGPLLSPVAITGACDMRWRGHVRNTADTGTPDPSQFRIAGIAAHDPDRSTVLNYVHIGGGSTNQVGNRIEWKTTDDSVSTFGDNGVDVAPLDLDLRIVRRPEDLQLFDLLWRTTGTAPLVSDEGWSLLQRINRADNTAPARATAVPLPRALHWGLMLYANPLAHDIRSFSRQVTYARP